MEGTALDMTHFSYYFVSSSHQPTPSLASSTSNSHSSSPSPPFSPFYSFPFKLFNATICKDFMRSNGIANTENVKKRCKIRYRLPRSINPEFSKRNLNKP
jgi:hypothetical protein